ncbi:MAG: peptidylprolyl isomerase, partial [Bauldia sp.]
TVSPVVNGQFGPVILRVESIQPEAVKGFDEMKADIKKEIAVKHAAEEVNTQHDMVEDERAAGSTLTETAAKYGLKTTAMPAIDQSGNGEDGKPVTDIPGGADLVKAAFDSDVGIENDPIAIDNRTGYVWYDVTAITQARDRQLDEVRGEVVAAWKKQQALDKVAAKAKEVRDRLAKGEDIAKVATELGVEVKTADKVIRGTPASNDLPAPAVAAAFEGPKGYVAVSPGSEEGSQVVILVKDAVLPAYAAEGQNLDDVGKQLGVQISNDVLAQYISEMQNQLGVTINQAALQQILSSQPGS